MKKQLISFSILITLLLLIGFSFLPMLATGIQDHVLPRGPASIPLQSIDPAFLNQRESLSIMERLALLSKYECMSIVPAMASKTEAEVLTAVKERLQPFIAEGLIADFPFSKNSMHPLVATDPEHPSDYMIYWQVNLNGEQNGVHYSLSLEMDDETGTILVLHYSYFQEWEASVGQIDPALLERFSGIYFRQLGIDETAPTESLKKIPDSFISYHINDRYGDPFYIEFSYYDNSMIAVSLVR